jgi:sec-independent protein translocase protein TatA
VSLIGARRWEIRQKHKKVGNLMFHWPELLVVMGVALLIFGPRRLPEMGSAIGKTFKEFRKSVNEITEQTKVELPTPQTIANQLSPVGVAEPVATTDTTLH